MRKLYILHLSGKKRAFLYNTEKNPTSFKLRERGPKREGYRIFENIHLRDEFIVEDIQEQIFILFMTELVNAANDMLPNGIKDLDIIVTENGWSTRSIKVIYRWGDLEITNSRGQTHPIRGLYTSHGITYYRVDNKINMYGFSMFRDTYTRLEKRGSYCHSHVPGLYPSANLVCLGLSELKRKFFNRARPSATRFDAYRFMMYVDSFTRWESLEGGPHRQINHLYAHASESSTDNSSALSVDSIMSVIDKLDAKVLINGKNIEVPSNLISEAVHEAGIAIRTLYNSNSIRKEKWWLDFTETGTMGSRFIFRNKKVPIKIIAVPEEDDRYTESIFCGVNSGVVSELKRKFSRVLTDNSYIKKV